MSPWLYDDAYFDGQRVKKKYLEAYDGTCLEDAIEGTPVRSDIGECYLIESSSAFV